MGLFSDRFRMEYEGNSIEAEARLRLLLLLFSVGLIGAVKGIAAAARVPDYLQADPSEELLKEITRYRLFINDKRVDQAKGHVGTYSLRGQLRAAQGGDGKHVAVRIKQGWFRTQAFLEVDGDSFRMTKVQRLDVAEYLLWLFGGGLLMGLVWWLAGVIMFCTVIGIPRARACFVLGTFALLPFGRDVVRRQARNGDRDLGTASLGLWGYILWLMFGGLWLALAHASLALVWAITILGIPFAFQHLRLALLAIGPGGKTVVATE